MSSQEDAVQEGSGVAKHSPAPWRWMTDVRTGAQHRDVFAMRYLVAANGQGFAHTVGLMELDTGNADLMAAAPDLLAALEACEENLRLIHGADGVVRGQSDPMPKHSTFSAWHLATEAIRKARGIATEPLTPTSNQSNEQSR